MNRRFVVLLIVLSLFISNAYTKMLEDEVRPTTTILVLGDSLSAAHNLPLSKGWVALLQQQLKQQSINKHVENASVSGLTTAAAIAKIDDLLISHNPELVILELGANDGLQGKPLKYIETNLGELIEKIKSHRSKVLLLGVHLPPNLGKRYTEPFFKQYQMLADKYQVGIISFILEGVATNQQFMLEDGLHPNEEGQRKVFEHLWPGLKEAITGESMVRR